MIKEELIKNTKFDDKYSFVALLTYLSGYQADKTPQVAQFLDIELNEIEEAFTKKTYDTIKKYIK